MIAGFQGRYRWLSNFWPAPITDEGVLYPTVEHAYQALKTLDTNARLRIANLATPGEAKRAGRKLEVRADWNEVKIPTMLMLLRRKFQHDDLRQKLKDTGDEILVELNTWGDRFWGHCPIGVGENHLGKLLMQVREELK